MAQPVSRILIPTRPQPDTLVAIFLLKTFGGNTFRGVEEAAVEVKHLLPEGETYESMLEKGVVALDLGGGALDHHDTEHCTSELVAAQLGIEKEPSIQKLLQYARRDDKEGKGTLSTDGIDRAFGLSGLVASLNKLHLGDAQAVVDAVLPLLHAHYVAARQHHVELPEEVARKKSSGEYEERTLNQQGKKLLLAAIVSDKPSMPTFLRSQQGPRADVVLQKTESKNHFCILSKQERKLDLSKIAGLIRLREAQLRNISIPEDETYLEQKGRVAELPLWYFDPATNSILNGGVHSPHVEESLIDWEELKNIVHVGLQMGGKKRYT